MQKLTNANEHKCKSKQLQNEHKCKSKQMQNKHKCKSKQIQMNTAVNIEVDAIDCKG